MKNLCDPAIDKWRIAHPMGEVPDELRPWCGAFKVGLRKKGTINVSWLGVIASRGGGEFGVDDETDRWDHVSVSTPVRCPTWEEMCFIKDLFFEPHEVAAQLHPVKDYINNHPFCLHLWRPLDVVIPLPPSILVGLPELNVA